MNVICTAATTANLTGTYANGTTYPAGQLATFTFTATGAQFFDGVQLVLNLIVLVKNQSNQAHNGIYKVKVAGDVGISCVLGRYAGANTPIKINESTLVAVVGGTTQAQSTWSLLNFVSEIGTDNLIYTPISNQNGTTLPWHTLARFRNTRTVTAATDSMTDNDDVIYCNRAGVITMTLPATITGLTPDGRECTIKDISGAAAANNITVQAPGGLTIDGAATAVINTNYGSYTFIRNATNWSIL